MYALIIAIHVIACLILIAVILFQSGRGAGVSEMFGSGATQTIFGTRASTFLTRTTTAAAIIFLFTCISLTIFSSTRVRSLMTGVKETPAAKGALPQPTTQAIGGIPVEIQEQSPAQTQTESPTEKSEEKPEEKSAGSETKSAIPQEQSKQ